MRNSKEIINHADWQSTKDGKIVAVFSKDRTRKYDYMVQVAQVADELSELPFIEKHEIGQLIASSADMHRAVKSAIGTAHSLQSVIDNALERCNGKNENRTTITASALQSLSKIVRNMSDGLECSVLRVDGARDNFRYEDKEAGVVAYVQAGYVSVTLSEDYTHDWAHRPGSEWPCSTIAGKQLHVEYDTNGLTDGSLDSTWFGNLMENGEDIDASEMSAMVSDALHGILPEDHACYAVIIGQFREC